MGEVYLAHAPDGAEVAVKCIRAHMADQPEVRRRFAREARAAAKLDHPNIARLVDFGVDAGRAFMAMELVRGGTLADWRKAPPDGPTLLQTFDAILAALAHAHARGIVHRDLKPENILLGSGPAGRPTPKLMDFGVVHFRDESGTSGESHQILGTPAYMSPEQAMQLADAAPASDLYAVGVMLFEMLTGALPFAADSAAAMIVALMNSAIPAVELREGYASESDWDGLMAKLLAKEPGDRFLFAADARAALATMRLHGRGLRLESAAPPSESVWVTAARTTAGVETAIPSSEASFRREPTAISLTAPLQLFQLRDVRFRGRADVRETILDRLRRAVDDRRGGVTLVAGEMGLGKTRLLARLREHVEESGWMQVWPGEFDGRPAGPDVGLTIALRRGLGMASLDSGAARARLERYAERHGIDDPWELEALAELLIPRAGAPDTPRLGREETRWALIERVLDRATRTRPLLVMLDDVHLGDGAALRFLEYLRRGASSERQWHVVATYRPEHLRAGGPAADGIARLTSTEGSVDADAAPIELERFDLRTVQAIVSDALPMAPGVASVVAMRAGGNPMFAVELVRHLVDTGRLEATGGQVDPEELLLDLPVAVGTLLRRRLEESAGEHLHVWERMAFLGLRFAQGLARTLVAGPHPDDELALQHALSAGLVAGVLLEEDDDTLRFENALARDALLERVAERGDAPAFERAAGEAKRSWSGDADELALDIARHFDRAGDASAAMPLYERAALHAANEDRPTAALDAWRSVDALLDAGAVGDDIVRVRALLGQADAQLRLARWDDATKSIEVARRIAQLSRWRLPARATRLLGEIARNKGDIREARSRIEAARSAAERDEDAREYAYATFGLGRLELRDGRLQMAEGRFREARDRFAAIGDRPAEAASIRELGRTAFATGLYEEAMALGVEARSRSDEAGDRHGAALARILLGEVDGALGNGRQATEAFEVARDELRAVGDQHGAAAAVLAMGSIARAQDLPDAARAHLEEASFAFRDMGDRQQAAIAGVLLAAIDAEQGRWEQAEPRLDEALARDADERIDDPRFVSALVDLARLAIFGGRTERARSLLKIASWKLERIAHESPLYDRVDEVEYLSAELADDGEQNADAEDAVIDWLD